jgi:predicted amidohydrolase YtcJ
MYEPWHDGNGNGVWAGVAASNTFQDWLSCVTAAKFSPIVHAIGDQAVGLALDSMASISMDLLPRIEHAQFISKKDMNKVSGRCFGIQPLHQPHDAKMALKAVGSQRIGLLHDWRSMVDAGAALSFGSDWPVAPVDPIGAMQIAIRRGLSPQEVMKMSTSISADSLRSPQAGRLTVGSYGDVVVLDRHPFECDWITSPPSVIMTIVAGVVVYQGESNCA